MPFVLFIEHALNGLQLGVMLFLMAAGLTLVFGIMNLINLAHGSLYMVGAFVAATVQGWTGSFLLGLLAAIPAAALVGALVELVALRRLYARDHLDQVLATFGLILFFNELVRMVWGPAALFMDVPAALAGSVELLPGLRYPAYRLAILGVGLLVAVGLWLAIERTRAGMLVRAGATHRDMVAALGVDVGLLFTAVFALGAGLAGLAGAMAGPILSVEAGMGEHVLILTFITIVVGGLGSIRGAFAGAVLVGLVDTFGRVLLTPAFAQVAISALMVAILLWRPRGLLPAPG